MKNKLTIILSIFFYMFGKLSYSNPYQPYSPQWNAYQQQIYGQIEEDKKRAREREAQMAAQAELQKKVDKNSQYERWSVFVWNEDTGDWYYHIDQWLTGNYKTAIKNVEMAFKEYHREKDIEANKHIHWEGPFRGILAYGRERKSEKWNAYFMYGASSENKDKLLKHCNELADYCELIID